MDSKLILYTSNSGDVSVQVQYEDGTFWLTQRRMSELFNVNVSTINEHLRSVFDTGELSEEGTIRKSRIVQQEGSRTVSREVSLYPLEAIIATSTLCQTTLRDTSTMPCSSLASNF